MKQTISNSVHMVLQGKGGVGKSLIASMLAQYFHARKLTPICADTDPVNSTFSQIKALSVMAIPIIENGIVVQRLFDLLFEAIIESNAPVIVDNGASTFLPIVKYIQTNDVFSILDQSGKSVFIHTVITGGQAKDDTVAGLLALFDLVKGTNVKVVVWQNEFWGIPQFNGVELGNMPWMKKNADLMAGIVKIIDRNSDAFTTDLRLMSEKHLTVDQVNQSDEFKVFARSRIVRVFNDVYTELDGVFYRSPLPEIA